MYQTIEFSISYVNEPENIYYSRTPAPRRYRPGNSYNTYWMVKEAIAFRQGYWLILLDTGALAHTEKLGNDLEGFGNTGITMATQNKKLILCQIHSLPRSSPHVFQ